mmetsp:Transcript_14920/g.35588  ORF Transcript_14920/g.35588 Transcript_14920/m.35588 type:complete len:209 (+) Transcript_14920:127-753(+)
MHLRSCPNTEYTHMRSSGGLSMTMTAASSCAHCSCWASHVAMGSCCRQLQSSHAITDTPSRPSCLCSTAMYLLSLPLNDTTLRPCFGFLTWHTAAREPTSHTVSFSWKSEKVTMWPPSGENIASITPEMPALILKDQSFDRTSNTWTTPRLCWAHKRKGPLGDHSILSTRSRHWNEAETLCVIASRTRTVAPAVPAMYVPSGDHSLLA